MALAGLAAAPFLAPVEQTGEPPHRARTTPTDDAAAARIDGSMTLGEVAQMTGVPAEVILQELGLPPNTPADARLGRLRKEYTFELSDVRDIILKHLDRP